VPRWLRDKGAYLNHSYQGLINSLVDFLDLSIALPINHHTNPSLSLFSTCKLLYDEIINVHTSGQNRQKKQSEGVRFNTLLQTAFSVILLTGIDIIEVSTQFVQSDCLMHKFECNAVFRGKRAD